MTNPRLLLAQLSLSIAAVAATLGPGTASAETFKLTIASGQPPVYPYILLLRDYVVPEVDKRLLAAGGKHKVEWTQAYAGTVMKVGSEIESVSAGLVDVAFVLFPNNQSKIPLHSFTYMAPFASTNAAASVQAFNQTQQSIKGFADTWDKNNQIYLATVAVESFNLYSKKPIRKVDDLKGLKVGVIGPNANWLRGTGAVGVTFNLASIYNDLQAGIFDACLLADSVAASLRLHEAAPFRSNFDFGSFVFAGLTMNKDKWNAMPPEVREVFKGVAADYEKQVSTQLTQKAHDGVESMAKAGLTVVDVGPAGRDEWAKRMPDLAKEWAAQVSSKQPNASEIIPTYLANLRKAGVQPLRDWAAN